MSLSCASCSSECQCRVEARCMSLRRNALLLILLTGVLGIVGSWSADPLSGRLWALPAALLLSGLAYEAAMLGRHAVELDARVPEYWPLARSQPAELVFLQHSRPRLFIVRSARSCESNSSPIHSPVATFCSCCCAMTRQYFRASRSVSPGSCVHPT